MQSAKTELVVLSRSDVENVWRNIKREPTGYAVSGLSVVRWESSLFFGNSKGFEQQIKALVEQASPPPHWVVFDAEATGDADFTATSTLEDMIGWLHERNITFAVAEANGQMRESLERAGLVDLIGSDNIFPSVDNAMKAYLTKYPTLAPQRRSTDQTK